MKNINIDRISLDGLDGSNPLAFLAALGTLRILSFTAGYDEIQMQWEQTAGMWHPTILCQSPLTRESLVALLDDRLRSMEGHAAFSIGDDLTLPVEQFHRYANASAELACREELSDRTFADFLAAFGSDIAFDQDEPEPAMEDTALRTMSGAGHQHFLKFFRDLVRQTDSTHIQSALFETWDYRDEGRGLNLRWDPSDDRRYALRWEDPSGDPIKTMRGANRLAIEGLPLLPTMPTHRGLQTTGFQGKGRRETFFIWPIWCVPANYDVVRSLMGQSIALKSKDGAWRSALGVSAMYSSQRITTGKFRNFTPARAI